MLLLAVVVIWTVPSIPASLVLGTALHQAAAGFAADDVHDSRLRPPVGGARAVGSV